MELKPCPFCGGKATLEEVRREVGPDEIRFSVGCTDSEGKTEGIACIGYMSVMTYPRRKDAAEAWNKRAPFVQEEEPPESCQNCGKMIFDNMEGYDDAASAPYVTESGDLYCIPCGRRHDEEQARADEEDGFGDFDPYEAAGESPFGLPGGGRSL